MKPDDRVRLMHIADALRNAIRFIERRSREDLEKDAMLAFAVTHALQIVGEAASKISQETRDQNPQIPWTDIIGMRHRLVHAYVDIDPDIVWSTVTEYAPELLAQANAILKAD